LKQVPNVLSIARLLSAFVLPFLPPLSVPFIGLCAFGVCSDMLDGFLARRLNLQSDAGARLDSTADLLFTLSVMVSLFAGSLLPPWTLIAACAVALVRVLSLLIGLLKFHALASIHTYLNKAAGFALSLIPFFCLLPARNGFLIAATILASLSAAEELLIILFSDTLDRDRTGFFPLPKP